MYVVTIFVDVFVYNFVLFFIFILFFSLLPTSEKAHFSALELCKLPFLLSSSSSLLRFHGHRSQLSAETAG